MPTNSIWRKQLPSATTTPVGAFVERLLGEIDLHRRAAGIADHDRPVAVRGVGETAPVGILPAVGHQHVVGPQVGPVVQVGIVARLAKAPDRRQQKGQPRRGGGRVLHHRQPLVFGPDQVRQVGRVAPGRAPRTRPCHSSGTRRHSPPAACGTLGSSSRSSGMSARAGDS